MSKIEKMINSNNNTYALSNIRLKKANLHKKAISNKNKTNQKIKFPSKTKDSNFKNKLTKIIIDFFKKINEMDNNIEIIRSKLYLSPNFSEKKLFSFLDRNSKNFLTLNDFKLFLKENKIAFTEKNLRKFIHNFDKNNDFCLNFEEFLGIISPKKNNIIPNPNQKNEEGKPSGELQKIFCELISQELKFVEKYTELTEKIHKFKDFSPFESFKEIVGEEKYINIENLKKFLINKGVKIEENEINQLMFRIDKDNDDMVSYEEFKDIFSPLNNSEIISITNRDYNKDFFNQYDIDDEKENKNLNGDNYNNNININNDDDNNKNNLPLNIDNKFHYKENNQRKNNSNNLNKAEQRYNFNMESDLDNANNKKKYKNNRNFMINNELESSMSNSIYLYQEKMKNGKIDAENNKKVNKPRYKSVNNYYSSSSNNLLELTKTVLGINPNNILTKIRVNSNAKINTNNINHKKKIIEIEYESDYNMETLNKKNKMENKNNNEKLNKTNPDPISDSILNYDYSRYTNKDSYNGSYYYIKKRNKGGITESNNSINNINIIRDNESNNNSNNKTNNTTFNKETMNLRKNEKNKNINKKNSFNSEYNYEDKFSFKDVINFNNKNKNNNFKKNKDNSEYQNRTFDKENFKKKNNLFFNYDNENDINQSDFDININNNNINNNNFNTRNDQKYLDSLENINPEKKEESIPMFKNQNNQYHYNNTKFKRNIIKNDIQSQGLPKGKTNNNTYFLFSKKNNNADISKDKTQSKSFFIPSSNYKNDLFNIGQENLNPNLYKISNNKIENHNYSSNRAQNNNFFEIDLEAHEGNIPRNINKKYNNKRNIKKVNKNGNRTKNYKPSSSAKNFYANKKNNNLNMDYSMDNINQNISPINNMTFNKNFRKNNMNMSIYKIINNAPKKIYRNSNKMNNNFNSNNSFYYLESSYNNDNFLVNQINSSIQREIRNKNYITYNLNRHNSNKFSDLYNLFIDFIQQDNIIEEKRQLLSNREDANLIDLFSLFDYKGNRSISSSDFIQTLNQLGLNLGKDEIKFLFRKFNKNLNDYFDFDEFCEIILPKKHSNEKIMDIERRENIYRNRRNSDNHNKNFSEISMKTKKLLGDLFKNVIEGEKSNENFRKILAKNGEISGSDLFNKIKKNYSVGIYKEDIANFMKKNEYKLSNKEIELLMERFDKNKNGIIDYKEFILEITPINQKLN